LKKQATRVRYFAELLSEELSKLGIQVVTHKDNHFDTIVLNAKKSGLSSTDSVLSEFHKYGINLRKVDDEHVGISFSETTTMIDFDELVEIFSDLKGHNSHHHHNHYENRKYKGLPTNL
jgi:glycine dehydrogenase